MICKWYANVMHVNGQTQLFKCHSKKEIDNTKEVGGKTRHDNLLNLIVIPKCENLLGSLNLYMLITFD